MSHGAAPLCAMLLVGAAQAAPLHVDSPQMLQERLAAMAEEHLAPEGWFFDRSRVRMYASPALPSGGGDFEIRTHWLQSGAVPRLPLVFSLVPIQQSGAPRSIRVTLALVLQSEAWVTTRSLSKGSPITCADLAVERRVASGVPTGAVTRRCDIGPGSVVVRDLGAREIVRQTDFGMTPAVAAGGAIDVVARVGSVEVSISGTALAEGRVGDQIRVRLQKPARIRKVQITAPGAGILKEGI